MRTKWHCHILPPFLLEFAPCRLKPSISRAAVPSVSTTIMVLPPSPSRSTIMTKRLLMSRSSISSVHAFSPFLLPEEESQHPRRVNEPLHSHRVSYHRTKTRNTISQHRVPSPISSTNKRIFLRLVISQVEVHKRSVEALYIPLMQSRRTRKCVRKRNTIRRWTELRLVDEPRAVENGTG